MRRDIWAAMLAFVFLGLVALRAMADEPPVIDLNRASMQELMQLPGVGPKRAEDIVRFRNNHPFRRTADLMRIKGFGNKMFARLRPLVRVEPAAAPTPNPGNAAN